MSGENSKANDLELTEWIDSLQWVIDNEGNERAKQLVKELHVELRKSGIDEHFQRVTPYINTIPPHKQLPYPGSREIERRIRSLVRWNAMAMVHRANSETGSTEYGSGGVGGHISTFASAATLWEVGFNHFFRNKTDNYGGDVIFFQGHASPGVYSRAYLEGRLTEKHLSNFRRELADGGGLSSYPHPWLMPDFWQYPTVSMGLGPMMAIYQARFQRYLENRGLKPKDGGKIVSFIGDGESDEPETLGAINLAVRENLDNLIFIVNCNLQRLDGPVRGNGKIIQELEGSFRGSGWNVIKVIWGSNWDELLEKDTTGLLIKLMEETVDGEYQKLAICSGDHIRKEFFGKYPELLELVKNMSDEEITKLTRGGHDPDKVYNAYKAAWDCEGKPSVILAKTIKGYGLGETAEGKNPTHNTKKMNEAELYEFRSRFGIPIPDEDVLHAPFYRPNEDSQEMQYLHARRKALGGYLPVRVGQREAITMPDKKAYDRLNEGTNPNNKAIGVGNTASTTMSYVSLLGNLLKDKNMGHLIVPIVPDEARTFGMEGLFRQVGIYASDGQKYVPVDKVSIAAQFYKESKDGQILQEGINEDGSLASFIAAGTAYSTHGVNTIPFYVYYSMFGFQRVGDFCWAAGDARTKGFLFGATAGRTTLNGEGLQHQDGHSHLLSSTVPNCISYDPAYAYELGILVEAGIKRMYVDMDDVFYYITLHNDKYEHLPMPADKDIKEKVVRGIYKLKASKTKNKAKAQLFGSAVTVPIAIKAAEILEKDYKVSADVWSVTSYTELRREALDCDRQNLLHPDKKPHVPYISYIMEKEKGVVVAASDYMKILPEGIRKWIPQAYTVLGTDGYGRSEIREVLRDHFEINEQFIVLATLTTLVDEGALDKKILSKAIKKLGIDPDKINPQYA